MKRYPLAFLSMILILLTLISPSVLVKATTTVTEDDEVWPDGPNVYAESAIVMEASTGLILYEKNIDDVHYPASITKIMSALLAMENSSLGEVVTFSTNAVFKVDLDSSRIGIDVDEQLTMQQCLYAMLLESANEVSYAVAEYVSGTAEDYAKLMTEKAKSLGCKNTNFVNPHGLHDENHYTTAYDMALITRAAMQNDTFRKIIATRTYQIPPTNIQAETRYLRNHHKFILKQDYLYEDCIGGKTGYTSKSKFTLVSVAKRGDLELICVIMRDDSREHQYTDTQKLFDFAFDNFSIYPIADLESNQSINESPMFTRYNPLLSKSETPILIDEKGYLVLPNTASFADAQKEVIFYSADTLNINKGEDPSKIAYDDTTIGKISYTYHEKYIGGADILYKDIEILKLAQKEAEKNNPVLTPVDASPSKSDESLRPVILGGIVGLFVLVIGLYFVLVERPRLKRRNAYYKNKARRRQRRDDDFLDL